jgi:hypothetical protein
MSTARSPAPSTSQEELFQPGSPGAKWLESVSPKRENDTDKADPHASTVTPRPNAARQLFPLSIAPTVQIAQASAKSLSPIQRRAQRGTGERQIQLTAAATAVAAAVTEATKLLEEAFDKASEDRVNDETAAQPAALIPTPRPTTQPNNIQTTNQPNDNNTNTASKPHQREQLTTNPTTPRQEIDKTSLPNKTPPSARIKPSQLSVPIQATHLPRADLSFLMQSNSPLCEMRTVLERAAAAYPLESQHLSDKHSISGINDLVQYTTNTPTRDIRTWPRASPQRPTDTFCAERWENIFSRSWAGNSPAFRQLQ